jgi:cellobiose phosphorylase
MSKANDEAAENEENDHRQFANLRKSQKKRKLGILGKVNNENRYRRQKPHKFERENQSELGVFRRFSRDLVGNVHFWSNLEISGRA